MGDEKIGYEIGQVYKGNNGIFAYLLYIKALKHRPDDSIFISADIISSDGERYNNLFYNDFDLRKFTQVSYDEWALAVMKGTYG